MNIFLLWTPKAVLHSPFLRLRDTRTSLKWEVVACRRSVTVNDKRSSDIQKGIAINMTRFSLPTFSWLLTPFAESASLWSILFICSLCATPRSHHRLVLAIHSVCDCYCSADARARTHARVHAITTRYTTLLLIYATTVIRDGVATGLHSNIRGLLTTSAADVPHFHFYIRQCGLKSVYIFVTFIAQAA